MDPPEPPLFKDERHEVDIASTDSLPACRRMRGRRRGTGAGAGDLEDTGAVESLAVGAGRGGGVPIPGPPFRFVEEDLCGTSPKVRGKDAAGRLWPVK